MSKRSRRPPPRQMNAAAPALPKANYDVVGSPYPVVASQPFNSVPQFSYNAKATNASSIVAAFSVPPVLQTLVPFAEAALPDVEMIAHAPKGEKPSDQQVQEAEAIIRAINKVVDPLDKARWVLYDTIGFRHSLFNYNIINDQGRNVPGAFIHLAAESFAQNPSSMTDQDLYFRDPLLRGLVFDKTAKVQRYFQKQTKSGEPVEIPAEQILQCTYELPGNESILGAILPTIYFWNICRRSLGLSQHRLGEPNAVITTSVEAMNWWAEHASGKGKPALKNGLPPMIWDYLDQLVALQSAGNRQNLPPGSNLSYPPVNMMNKPQEVEQYIERCILQSIMPSKMLDTLGGAKLSSSGGAVLELFVLLTNSKRKLCVGGLEKFYTTILADLNGFTDWEVTAKWASIVPEDVQAEQSSIRANQLQGIMTINQARKAQGLDELPHRANVPPGYTGETLEDLYDEYRLLHAKTAPGVVA